MFKPQIRIPATYMRGGGLYLHKNVVPDVFVGAQTRSCLVVSPFTTELPPLLSLKQE